MPSNTPQYPCIIVHDDGSLGVFVDLADWSDDVDQWYWSCAESYLIDQKGYCFGQVGEWDDSGRPIDIPTWQYTQTKSDISIRDIVSAQYKEIHGFVDYSIPELIDYIHHIEN